MTGHGQEKTEQITNVNTRNTDDDDEPDDW